MLGSAALAPKMELVLSAAVLLQAPALGQDAQLAGYLGAPHSMICRGHAVVFSPFSAH